MVANKFVDVLLVVVLLIPVKFCKVDEPVTKRLVVVNSPLELMEPNVAEVANRFVEVEFVVVELIPVKFCKVVDELICSCAGKM